ncbi:MAG: radical SAM protein [Myxococcaceae bacterium]
MNPSPRHAQLVQIDRDFRAALPLAAAPPTRFYVNLSDRCQLRCRHCITRAPELTAAGQARDLGPEVVEALRPHLAHAAYLGFTHAGEPLIAKALVPLLTALGQARAGRPMVVHLLTNGMALSEARFAELVGLGVCSWSVSIDGMSPATHDALRAGSRIGELLPRVRRLSELRAAKWPTTRLGVAWTMTRSNLGEVDALVRWAAEARLDWVKLEELFPTNDAAARELANPVELAAAAGRAARLAKGLGLALLDHTRELPGWKCLDDPQAKELNRLDDFVNRMDINPCRLPYEVVCVEPNGEVKPLSFHHPPAGSLLEQGLLELWRSEPFVRAREAAAASRPCARGPATCPADPGPGHW